MASHMGPGIASLPLFGCTLVTAFLVFSVPASAQPIGEWRAIAPSGRATTYASPDGEVTATVRCAPSRGYVEQVFLVRGPLDLASSRHGDGRMVDLTISYRSVSGPGGLTSGQLATVAPRDGGHELVAATTANSLPNLAAGEARPKAFEVSMGGRAFRVPFLPADYAARLERACGFRWYDHVLGGIGMIFSSGR